MNFLRRVSVTEQEFNIIKNNQLVGVVNTLEEGMTEEQLEKIAQFYLFKHINFECFFDDTALPATTLPGDLIRITMMDHEGLIDKSSPRITIQVDEVHHVINRMSAPNEICINFYEYSLLTPAYFFNEGADNGQ
ncbi:hypothetical protein [Xenorhabdus bovienii]|uniref:hypothetical protein n=1 Tax=Xenorhabdus bovienii TaxID=40576 RepID=UPI0023B2B868|nr:hypothetical protein [Xenorhabdus bovienii]MDE9455754.1 hypothetical protein [Xenorhabdus bovienii]MDE9553248.1 hypothetical protein [Xenorhabdus bovienii]MDE9565502.1 hypothetical protein [Xenorhabdus bovienii]